jgi:hypothetical protein
MNFKRGLFRLWCVVSTLWFLLFGSLAIKDALTYLELKRDLAPFFARTESCDQWLDVAEDATSENKGCYITETESAIHTRVRNALRSVEWELALALAVPLIILVLGSALYWAISGFKMRTPPSS